MYGEIIRECSMILCLHFQRRINNRFNCPQDSSQEEKTAKLPEPEGYQWPSTIDMLKYVFKELAEKYTSGK